MNRMRLIDADKVDFSKAFGGQSDFAKDPITAAQKLIDMQPTAFDKEKVIEGMRNEIHLTVYDPLIAGRYIKKERAIEIVEKGGID